MFDLDWSRGPVADVQDSAELRRIAALPRRVWTPEQTADIVARMTEAHKTPSGTMTLLPLQAIALAEMAMMRGCFVGIPVGGGKTLVQLLSARMFRHVKRPLYLLPAHLVGKTEIEAREYRKHWILPHFYRVESYQTLSRIGAKDLLEQYQPDLIVCDEAHYAKNLDAGVTKRIRRYREAHPDCIFVSETGTPFGVSLSDFSHLMTWALGEGSPVPNYRTASLDLDEWRRALDTDIPEARQLGFGALSVLDPDDPVRGYQNRLRDTPGVILSKDPPLPIPIHIAMHEAPTCPQIEQGIADLRSDWATPDGILARDSKDVWRHIREISTGFYQVWTPRAPDEWREARCAWARECRRILGSNRRELDTEFQLVQHIDAHPDHYPEACDALRHWRAVEPTFTPNPVPYWFSDAVVDWIVKWARGGGLIWTDRPTIGRRLASRGIAYYGEEGIDEQTGRYVMDHDPSKPAVLARKANDSGRNLQAYHRNLIVDVPSRGTDWEQLLGRTHRQGQKAKRIDVDVLAGSVEDVEAFWKAHRRALRAQDLTGQPQKLCYADLSCVLDLDMVKTRREPRWQKTK